MRGPAAVRIAIVVAALSISAGLMDSVAAAPLAPATAAMTTSAGFTATEVRWRHGGGGGALAAGLLTGMMIGGLLAAPGYEPYPYYPYPYGSYYDPRYIGPIGSGSPGWEAYCISRYRSFDPISGTYMGRDGRRHYCG